MTVYNTLKVLSANNLVKTIPNNENIAHFDFNMTPHVHFKCRSCKKVFDIDVKIKLNIKKEINGFIVQEHNVVLEGLCPECNLKRKNKR